MRGFSRNVSCVNRNVCVRPYISLLYDLKTLALRTDQAVLLKQKCFAVMRKWKNVSALATLSHPLSALAFSNRRARRNVMFASFSGIVLRHNLHFVFVNGSNSSIFRLPLTKNKLDWILFLN